MEGETDFLCRFSRKIVGPGHQRFCSSAMVRDHSKTWKQTQKQAGQLAPSTMVSTKKCK